MSRLQRLREKRVQTRVHALLSCFLVSHLQIRTHSNAPSGFLGRRAAIICVFVNERWSHFTLQLSNSFSEVSLGGLRQLRVEALGEALPAALLVFTLREHRESPHCLLFTEELRVEWEKKICRWSLRGQDHVFPVCDTENLRNRFVDFCEKKKMQHFVAEERTTKINTHKKNHRHKQKYFNCQNFHRLKNKKWIKLVLFSSLYYLCFPKYLLTCFI